MMVLEENKGSAVHAPAVEHSTPRLLNVRRAILELVFRHRRLLPGATSAAQEHDSRRHEPHIARLDSFLEAGEPVHFVLPAFPAKSPNRAKTISAMPDLGERLALGALQRLCDRIRAVYAPGAVITICSDGHVFGNLVGVDDGDVSRYRVALQTMIGDLGARSLRLFGLADVFGGEDFDMMRDELLVLHARPVALIRDEARRDATAKALFNGIHRFLFEDLSNGPNAGSRNRCRERSKVAAYRVIQRSNAWSALVAERFPGALRLSIHPQPDVSDKIGIPLLATDDPWVTPWHSVVLHDGDQHRLVKRSAAEAMGATLATSGDGLPYYAMPPVRRVSTTADAGAALVATA